MRELAGIETDEEIWRRLAHQPVGATLRERPVLSRQISNGVVSEWQLPVSGDQFLQAFLRWPTGPFPRGTRAARRGPRPQSPSAASATRTPRTGSTRCPSWPLLTMFDYRFLSFELGQVATRPRGLRNGGLRTPPCRSGPGAVPRRQCRERRRRPVARVPWPSTCRGSTRPGRAARRNRCAQRLSGDDLAHRTEDLSATSTRAYGPLGAPVSRGPSRPRRHRGLGSAPSACSICSSDTRLQPIILVAATVTPSGIRAGLETSRIERLPDSRRA